VVVDIAAGGAEAILRAMGGVSSVLTALRQVLQRFDIADRLDGVGVTAAVAVRHLGVGGIAGRAAGRRFDARVFAPDYVRLDHTMTVEAAADAAARCRVALAEIGESLRLLSRVLQDLPDGETTIALPSTSGEGIGCIESHRGDVWTWLRLDHGQIAAAFLRDPAWAMWPLAEAALAGAAFEDVKLIRASLGLVASGVDL
jgi:Ni,Fe-hydrogenase III large subunit